MGSDLAEAPQGSIVVLQLCGPDPTGVDPSAEEWLALAKACKHRRHAVLFDATAEGLARGDPAADAHPDLYARRTAT